MLTAVIAGLAIHFWPTPDQATISTSDLPAAPLGAAADRPVEDTAARPVALQPAVAASAVHGELFERLKASTNRREFVRYALEHPELGGAFYADLAWSQCIPVGIMDPQRLNVEDPAVRSDAVQTIQRQKAACDGLEAQFGGIKNFAKLLGDLKRQGRDPLLEVSKKTTGVVNKDAQLDDIAQALRLAQASGDPIVLGMLVEEIGPALMAIKHGEVIFQMPAEVAWAASRIVGCEIGGYCVANPFALFNCMQKEPCRSIDYRDQIRGALKEGDRAQLDPAIALLRQALEGAGG